MPVTTWAATRGRVALADQAGKDHETAGAQGHQGIGAQARHLLMPLPLEADRRAQQQRDGEPERGGQELAQIERSSASRLSSALHFDDRLARAVRATTRLLRAIMRYYSRLPMAKRSPATTTPVSVKLRDDERDRLAALATAHRSGRPTICSREAMREYLTREEARQSFPRRSRQGLVRLRADGPARNTG